MTAQQNGKQATERALASALPLIATKHFYPYFYPLWTLVRTTLLVRTLLSFGSVSGIEIGQVRQYVLLVGEAGIRLELMGPLRIAVYVLCVACILEV